MNTEIGKVTLDIAQIVMLAALIWGLARMSKSVDVLVTVTDKLTAGLEKTGDALVDALQRISDLEGRVGRRRTDVLS